MMMNLRELKIFFSEDIGEKVLKVSKINSGLHNINFLLNLENDEKVFAKFAGPSNIGKFKKQSALLDLISTKVLVPKLRKFSEHKKLKTEMLYFEFIEGEEKTFDKLSSNQVFQLGEIVAEVHSFHSEKYSPALGSGATEKGSLFDYARAIFKSAVEDEYKKYRNSLPSKEHGKYIDSAISEALQMTNDIPNKMAKFSLLHTDIGPSNIIWKDNNPYIIDWDDAMYGDAADEVGYIFAINNSKEPFRKSFIKGYMSKSQEDITSFTKRLPFYELKNRLFDVIWALSKLTPNSKTLKNQSISDYTKMYQKRYEYLEKHIMQRDTKFI